MESSQHIAANQGNEMQATYKAAVMFPANVTYIDALQYVLAKGWRGALETINGRLVFVAA